jgi:hypothetical protein
MTTVVSRAAIVAECDAIIITNRYSCAPMPKQLLDSSAS